MDYFKTYMLGTQRRTVLSLEEEANRWPEGENWTEMTASLCPSKRYALIWGFMFQIITQESMEPVAGRGGSTSEWNEHTVYEHRKQNKATPLTNRKSTLTRCRNISEYRQTNTKHTEKSSSSYQFVSCCSWSPHLSLCPCDPWNVSQELDQTR